MVLVVAKEPVAGRVKTRLCPPLDPGQAASVAAAALADTLAAVAACGAQRRVLALDGRPGEWLPPGFELVAQRGDGLAERLANAWSDADGAGVQIGMDTPQVSASQLDRALALLDATAPGPAGAAVLGPATDGGWWAIGLSRPAPEVFEGVEMSTAGTGAAQRRRLGDLGWAVADLDELRDIDTAADLGPVAAAIPGSRTSDVVAGLGDLR